MKHPFKEGDPAIIKSTANPLLVDNIGKMVTFLTWWDDGDPKYDCLIEGDNLLGTCRWTGELKIISGAGRSHSSRLMPLIDDNNEFTVDIVKRRQPIEA